MGNDTGPVTPAKPVPHSTSIKTEAGNTRAAAGKAGKQEGQDRPVPRPQPVEIILLPPTLESLPRDARLEGEVLRIDPRTQQIHLRTPQGDIVLAPPPAEGKAPQQAQPALPVKGQKLTVTLSAGTPPESAQIQVIPQEAPATREAVKPQTPEQPAPPPQKPLAAGDSVTAIVTHAPAPAAEEAAIKASEQIRAALLQQAESPTVNAPLPEAVDLQAAAVIATHATTAAAKPAEQSEQQTAVTPQPPASPLLAVLSVLEDGLLAEQKTPAAQKPQAELQHLRGQIFRFDIIDAQTPQKQATATAPKADTKNIATTEKTPLTVTVTEHSPAGLPIATVTTSNIPELPQGAQIVLQTSHPAPIGTVLSVTATPVTPEQFVQQLQTPSFVPQQVGAAASVLPPLVPLLSTSWPALEEALRVSDAIAPDAAAALRGTIPAPTSPARLVPTVLFFLAALRMGNLEGWLGERNMDTLKQSGRRDVISRLTSDFRGIARQAQEVLSGDWRGISLPLLNRDDIDMIQFFTRQQHVEDEENNQEENNNGGNDGKTTRFLLNLRLSRLGDVQIDGFLRHQQTLDVFLRTRTPLPADTRQDILRAFHDGLEQAGLSGGQMAFQTGEAHWMHVPAASGQSPLFA
ncbi:MAG: hypothetical protein EP349_03510 [Alphaproteobacteria bacterium]|nr:MAG: hypothetical protein EP349_03510 [Alphaproteobacteria bacterium]